MGLFDDIPAAGSPAPKGGLFDDIPADFDARFEGDKAAMRPRLEQDLVRRAEGMGRPTQGKAAILGAGGDVTPPAPQGFGAAYDARLGSARQQVRDAEMIYPKTTFGAQVVGAIPGAALAPGLRGAMALGGLTGAGSGEGVSDRLFQGAVGTAVGAAAHGVVTGVTRAGAAL